MGGQPVLVTRTGWTGELGFEVYTRPRHGPRGAVDPCDGRGRFGTACWTSASTAWTSAASRPPSSTTAPTSITRCPPGPRVSGHSSTSRSSDFFGRDALEAITDRRTRVYGITCNAAEPLIGGLVARNGKEIGHVTAAGWSPFLERGRCLCPACQRRRSRTPVGRGHGLRPRHARGRRSSTFRSTTGRRGFRAGSRWRPGSSHGPW